MSRPSNACFRAGLSGAWAFVLYLFWIILAGTVLSVGFVAWARSLGGGAEAFVEDTGPDRIFRRCMVLGALLALPWLLKRLEWRGWRDVGWHTRGLEGLSGSAWRLLLIGVAGGVFLLAVLSLVDLAAGVRFVSHAILSTGAAGRCLGYAAAALFIAVIEESLCRGMLYRSAARLWGFWTAGLATSLFFALAHFISPAPEAFEGGLSALPRVALSSLAHMSTIPALGLRMLNLTLLGLVLCALTRRTGSLWAAIGFHAGCVWVMKFNGYLTDIVRERPATLLLGQRSDTTDGLLATLLLLTLLGLLTRLRTTAQDPHGASRNGKTQQM